MAKEHVNIKVTADMAEAIRAWKEMQKGPQQLAEEMSRMGKKGKKANQSIAQSVGKSVKQWIKATLAVGGLTRAVQLYSDELRRMGSEALDSGLKLSLLITKMRIQRTLEDPEEAGKAVSRALLIGQRLGVSNEVTLATQTELDSQDFGPGSLRAALEGQIATNKGRDPSVAIANVRAQGLFLNAARVTKSAANLRVLAVNIASLFSDTPLQAEDLEFIARTATALRSKGFSADEVLAFTASISQSLGPRRGATGFRTVIERLGTARKNTEAIKGLRALGLSPDDVDFVGESPIVVSERFSEAIARTRANDPKALSPALAQIVGIENVSAALLFADTAALRKNIGKLGNETKFKANIKIFGSSPGAVNTRIENQIQLQKASRTELASINQEVKQFDQELFDRDSFINNLPVVGAVDRAVSSFLFQAARNLGVSREGARIFGTGLPEEGAGVVGQQEQVNVNVNLEAVLTDERGAHQGNVSAVRGANEDE